MSNVIPFKQLLTVDPESGKIKGEGGAPGEVDQTGADAAATLNDWAKLAEQRRKAQEEERKRANRSVARSYRLPTKDGETKK